MFSKRLIMLVATAAALLCCTVCAIAANNETSQSTLSAYLVTTPRGETPGSTAELLASPTLQEQAEAFAAARYDGVLVQCDDAVNLRKTPIDGQVLRMIRTGRVAHLVGTYGNWYKVVYGSTTGYVCADYCQLVRYEDYALTAANATQQELLVDYALEWLGVRYRYGGSSMSGTDCSGFTMAVFSHFGYSLPHSATAQFYDYPSVTTAERDVGDLVFFSTGGDYIGHVGIYLGDGQFIHASTSQGVRIDSVYDGYYGPRYRGAVRVLGT